MKFLIIAAIIIALVLWYALQGRDWLKSKSWAEGFFVWIEPFEIALYKKSQTILFARFKMLIGVTLTALTSLGTIDLTPIMPFVPDQYEATLKAVFNLLPMIITIMGWMDEKLRNETTKPIELVAVAEKDITPQIAQAIESADATKAEAVAAVTELKGI